MVFYVFLIRVCDNHSATWHLYFSLHIKLKIRISCFQTKEIRYYFVKGSILYTGNETYFKTVLFYLLARMVFNSSLDVDQGSQRLPGHKDPATDR